MADQQNAATPGQEFKPGDTVSPRSAAPAAAPAPVDPVVMPAEPAAQPQVPNPGPAASAPLAVPSADVGYDEATQPYPADPSQSISWTASEFIAHNKSATWYLQLGGAALVVAVLVFLLTKDKISTVVVIVAAIALGVYGARKPREISYHLDDSGVTVGDKYHSYQEFRSFAVIDEGAFASIVFMPLKRFSQLTTIYYDPKDEDAIIALLADRLPLEERSHDPIDRFMRRIHY